MYPNHLLTFRDEILFSDSNVDTALIIHIDEAEGDPNIFQGKIRASAASKKIDTIDAFSVLVVEDESIIAMDEAMMLREFGLNVVGIAGDGNEAIHLAELLNPDLILMDIDLGKGMDGIDAYQRIRNKCVAKVIFITGHHTEDSRIHEVLKLRNTWFVSKPINHNKLEDFLRNVLFDNNVDKGHTPIQLIG